MLILFDDDIKESVKATNVQNAISANSEHYLSKMFLGSMAPEPSRRPRKTFLDSARHENFF